MKKLERLTPAFNVTRNHATAYGLKTYMPFIKAIFLSVNNAVAFNKRIITMTDTNSDNAQPSQPVESSNNENTTQQPVVRVSPPRLLTNSENPPMEFKGNNSPK
jgi:hypothetical protein